MDEKDAVVLFSGGMDSTTALALAIYHNPGKKIHAITAFYGAKHNSNEIKAGVNVIDWYEKQGVNIQRRVVNLVSVFTDSKSKSALMGDTVKMPHLTYEEILASEGPSPTVVPFRNGVLLSTAASYANAVGAGYVYAGMHATDANNSAYPDCTWEFLEPMGKAIEVGTYGAVKLITPFIEAGRMMTKETVCALGIALDAPLHLTWSCYCGREKHCGICPTCVERIEAFKAASYRDAQDYEIDIDWNGLGPLITYMPKVL